MNKCLILQILGNSDVYVDSKIGSRRFNECTSYDYLEKQIISDKEKYEANKLSICFPLIEQLKSKKSPEEEYLFCIMLTDQAEWIKAHRNNIDECSIGSSDGHWWKDILTIWGDRTSTYIHPIDLKVGSQIENGVADWDGMAKLLNATLDEKICLDNKQISLNETIFDKIIVQHSSGTPALSSALYLWGIEKKLAGINVEFTYLSPKNGNSESESTIHDGNHWQWRLKVPQIRQLLEIQDFAGAHVLMQNEQRVKQEIKEDLDLLDRAISLNIKGSSAVSPKDEVIERISIALWSETAFRDRHQWTQWYMRIAGGLELALLCLVEHRGKSGDYVWKKKSTNRIYLEHIYDSTECSKIGINNVVQELLTSGEYKARGITYLVNKMDSLNWVSFKSFYCDSWIDNGGFITLRNNLYHSLMGDEVDEVLDAQTNHLGSANHERHPSRTVIDHLNYIIGQAQIKSEVDIKVCEYQQKVEEIKRSLS
jgi:hypothetical protein